MEIQKFTPKGRVGDFQYGYIGKMQWIVRHARTFEIVDHATNLCDAANKAKFHNGN